MTTIGGYDREQEDQDIQSEPPVAVGQPTKASGSLLDQLRAKFEGLDKDRLKVIKTTTRVGQPLWLEVNVDITGDETEEFQARAETGNRAARRTGAGGVSRPKFSAEVINAKNTRLWDEDPAAGARHLTDEDGDPLTVHAREWCEALGYPGDPIGGLRHLLGDPELLALYNVYSDATANGEGAQVVDPTRA